jgi:hypothetical protein
MKDWKRSGNRVVKRAGSWKQVAYLILDLEEISNDAEVLATCASIEFRSTGVAFKHKHHFDWYK